MPGKPPGPIVLGILRHLEEVGEATRAELCAALGVEKLKCASVVSRLNRVLPGRPKRLYVVRYADTDDTSGRRYPRAVYALGDKPDAKRPKANRKAASKRWRENKRARVSSVWEFAMPRRAREEARRNGG